MTSSTTSIARLKMQLPNASPSAIFGADATATALTPVNSSGSDVAPAKRTRPTHERDKPVSLAIVSA
jgi:hypothetical protein